VMGFARAQPAADCLAIPANGAILPDGQISDFMSSPIAKNIPLSPSGKSVLSARAIPFRKRGALAIVTNVGTGCGGRGSVGRNCGRRAVSVSDHASAQDERCGCVRQRRVVLAPVAGVKLAEVFRTRPGFRSTDNPSATVTRRIRRRGEHVISRKAIAQGMPDCSDCTCMLVCACYAHFCTRDRGCSAHPVFPAPSLRAKRYNIARASSRGIANVWLFEIRNLEHDPKKWVLVFPRDKRETFARRSCSNKKIERDDDSKKSHHALGVQPFFGQDLPHRRPLRHALAVIGDLR
jgi:hypothetical protein